MSPKKTYPIRLKPKNYDEEKDHYPIKKSESIFNFSFAWRLQNSAAMTWKLSITPIVMW